MSKPATPDEWDDAAAVEALRATSESLERLAVIAATRRRGTAGAAPDATAELPIQNLPAHVTFARHWEDRRARYLSRVVHRPCPVCGADAGTPWFATQDGYRYNACRQCAMVYIPEILPMEVWDEYFRELPQAHDSLVAQMSASISDAAERENRRRFGRYFDLLQSVGALTPGARLLDVGTFTGASLRVATARGLAAHGIEGLEAAVAFSHARLPELQVALAHAERFSPDIFGGGFNLVTMWETLEHTRNPLESLTRARDALAPGGWLALTVPNARNVQFSVLREYCFYAYGGYQGIGHVNLFTPATLEQALDAAGFTVAHVETEYGTDWRQIAYYLQHRFHRIYCYANLLCRGEFDHAPEPSLAVILNWLSPALTRLENAWRAGPIVWVAARRR